MFIQFMKIEHQLKILKQILLHKDRFK
jgi:hypothetical protein